MCVCVFGTPEHELLKVSYCDHLPSYVVRRQYLACELFLGYSSASIFLQLHQNVYLDNILIKFEYDSCRVKNMLLGQNPSDKCVRHSFALIFMNLHQNICLVNILVGFKYGSCWSKTRSK